MENVVCLKTFRKSKTITSIQKPKNNFYEKSFLDVKIEQKARELSISAHDLDSETRLKLKQLIIDKEKQEHLFLQERIENKQKVVWVITALVILFVVLF